MATLEIVFFSQCMQRTVELRAIVPADGETTPLDAPKPALPTLYLLHGLFGSNLDWLQNTRVAMWARARGMAVVMPSGENAFYVDTPGREAYARFIGEELPAFCRRLLPLSDKREDTFVGGLSMGGFGALLAGFRYPETFSKVVALSSAQQPWARMNSTDGPFVWRDGFRASLFGDDPERWNCAAIAQPGPELFVACGLQDGLLEPNRAMVAALREKGIPVNYLEGEGGHDWTFWDTYLHKGMDWLLPAK